MTLLHHISVLVTLPLVVAGCGADSARSTAPALATQVVTAPVASVQWRDSIQALGTLRANESLTLTAKVSETVRKVAFESGDLVEAGEVLVDLSSGVELAGLEEARADYREAKRLLQRQKELSARQLIAASEIDTQRAARDAARARMDVVRAELSDRVIVAPFDGVLGLRQVSVGSLVTPGTPIATLDDVSVMNLDFSVPERFLAILEPGQLVEARSTTYADREFQGAVANVDSRVDPITRSVVVRAEIPNADRLLRPGMLMSVTLFRPARAALVVPEIAVLQIGADSFVFRITPQATAERVKVVLGARRKGEVEIAEGLAAGDRIATQGIVKLSDGANVSEITSNGQASVQAASAADATKGSAQGAH